MQNSNAQRFWLTNDEDRDMVASYCHVEETLKARGGRMLLVETLASFDLAQAFYKKYGYEEEARIRDFYAASEDKVVFRKILTGNF